jgi:glycosyltransferase involved in cell wall biosynthesis
MSTTPDGGAFPASARALVLVDWYWGGHHPTYFAHFALALERLGIRVLGLCPQPEEARRMVAELRAGRAPVATIPMTAEFEQIPAVSRGRWLPSRLYAVRQTVQRFRGIERYVRRWQARTGITNCQIFYSCMYEWDFDRFKYATHFLALPWSGLYIRPATVRNGSAVFDERRVTPQVDRISNDKRLKGLAILDEGIREAFERRVGRPVVVFPDFTDERLPASGKPAQLAQRLRAFAGNRPIVGMFGHLQRSKGLTTFCAAAQNPALAGMCFAIVGEIDWLDFTPDERHRLQKCLAESPNVWAHLARVPDEPQLNALMAQCAVLFASYINFPHSSNILSKAAVLHKPIVVSDRLLMAERVRRFRLGEVVPQDDPDAVCAAILKIVQDVDRWVATHQPGWESYRQEHSFEALESAFARMVSPARRPLERA